MSPGAAKQPASLLTQPSGLSRLDLMRALRAWMWEAPLSSAQAAMTTGTFTTGFALFLGSSSFGLGVLAAIPPLVNALQLISSYCAHLIGSRARIVSVASLASRLIWLLILAIPFALPRRDWIPAYIVLTFVSNAFMAVAAPMWMDWMSDLVPADKRGRYFGRRNVYGVLTAMTVSVGGGAFLDWAVKDAHWNQRAAFAALFATSCLFAAGAFLCASASPDVSARSAPKKFSLADAVATYTTPLRDFDYRQVIMLSLVVTGIQTFNGNFFTAYQFEYLHYSYGLIQALGLAVSVAQLGAMPLWGYLADKFGNKPVLILSTFLVLPIPIMWCVTHPDGFVGLYAFAADGHLVVSYSKLMVILINVLSAFGWSGIGMGQFNLVIGTAPRESRAAYLAIGTALSGLMGALSPVLGGAVMQALSHYSFPSRGLVRSNYHALFVISSISRLAILTTAARIRESGSRSARYVLGQLRSGNPAMAAAAIQTLSRPTTGSGERRRAAERLGQLRAPLAVEELVRALDDAALPVREQAAQSLGEIGDSRAVEPLLEKLNDASSGIAVEAAQSLGKIGDKAALPPLRAIALDDDVPNARRVAATEALAKAYDASSAQVFVALMRSPSWSLRQAALTALAQRGEAIADPDVQRAALEEWRTEADPAALPLLAEIIAQSRDPLLAPLLVAGLARLDSGVARRELLNAVGTLLAGRDAFYVYLRLDRDTADETLTRMLSSLQRAARPGRGAPDAGIRARLMARVRQALAAYAQSDNGLCARRLAEAARLAAILADTEDPVTWARTAAVEQIAILAKQAQIGTEEILLAAFLLQVLTRRA